MNTQQLSDFLKKAILKNRMCHAIIIHGGSYEKRKNAAIDAARMLECKTSPEICGECYSCKTIPCSNFPDVHLVKPEKRNLSIDEVRTIKEQMHIKPYIGKHRIFIIETDWMQQPAANSLLKIMEEPPTYGILIVLVPNNKNFLPTIVSRALNLRLNPELEISPGDEVILEQVTDLVEKASRKNWIDFFQTAGEISKSSPREEIENIFNALVLIERQSLLKSAGINQSGLHKKYYSDKINDYRVLASVLDKRQYLRFNVNTRIFLETIAILISLPKWRNWQTR
ncbi:MAG: hypothetical protein NC831_07175 [Candidatus Omnitrophica bacterium]|nr:hypothetical protein [Candidatus Omnitrophota bacterium]MCM8828422.1 hypothetical protein [Candidatus Omnitrophota bacterium]